MKPQEFLLIYNKKEIVFKVSLLLNRRHNHDILIQDLDSNLTF